MRKYDLRTLRVGSYFLAFFAAIFLLAGFLYSIYETRKIENSDTMTAEEIKKMHEDQKIIKQLEDYNKELDPNNNINIRKGGSALFRSCNIEGINIKDGQTIRLYSTERVNIFDSCERNSQLRKCDDGFLTGNPIYKYLNCHKSADCILDDGGVIPNGQTKKFYSKQRVNPGEFCTAYMEERTCKDTVLTGDKRFKYLTCHVDRKNACQTDDGHYVNNNESHIFYSKKKVEYGEKCADYGKKFRCANGVLMGGGEERNKYKYWNCLEAVPKDCHIKDTDTQEYITIEHGIARVMYSKKYATDTKNCNYFARPFRCINGEMKDEDKEHPLSFDVFPYTKCW